MKPVFIIKFLKYILKLAFKIEDIYTDINKKFTKFDKIISLIFIFKKYG
jgi:hypothetical protein